MKEIIGENLSKCMSNHRIPARRTYAGSIGYWPHFEVWQMDDDAFETFIKLMDSMSDEQFEHENGNDVWWRSAAGSIMGTPCALFVINGNQIVAWDDGRRSVLCQEYDELDDAEKEEYKDVLDYINVWMPYKYDDLLSYFCTELGASTERNICALSVDLAKYNNMTMSELFIKYGGSVNCGSDCK